MKRLLNPARILTIIIFGLSCSTYSVKSDFKDKSVLSNVKNTGIIFRISNGSKITKEELIRNFYYWLSVYKKKGNITVISDASDSLTVFHNPQQRFYQLSNEGEYLEYKSLGAVNFYLQKNQNELLNIISKNNLDSIVVYEVYSVISTQMHFFEYDSVLAIADANLNIGYLDHQTDYFESESSFLDEMKSQAMDKITDRLIENLRDIDLLGSLTQGEKKTLIRDTGKSGTEIEVRPAINMSKEPAVKALEKAEEKTEEKDNKNPALKQEEKTPGSADAKVEEKQNVAKDIELESSDTAKPEKKEEVTPEAKSPEKDKPEAKPVDKAPISEEKPAENK